MDNDGLIVLMITRDDWDQSNMEESDVLSDKANIWQQRLLSDGKAERALQ